MAAQQTRNSYRWPAFNSPNKNQDSRPWGLVADGKATGNAVRSVELDGDMVSSCSVSRVGAASGSEMAAGARKMAFSVFARAAFTSSANRTTSWSTSLMVEQAKSGHVSCGSAQGCAWLRGIQVVMIEVVFVLLVACAYK